MSHIEYKQKQYYKLRREWKEHKTEYNDIKSIYDKICIQFINDLNKFCSDRGLHYELPKTSESTQNVSRISLSSKSFFRKIAISTHPDKVDNEEKTKKIYTQATKAKKAGNLQELYDAGQCLSLRPDISKLDFNDIDLLRENVNEIKNKILQIQNSFPWIWFYSNQDNRNKIFSDFIQSLDQ